MHLSTWNLDYMIPKGISHTSVQNPTYEFLVPFRKILVPFKTTKDCHSCRSLFLVWHMCTLNWDLDMDSFVGTFCISFDGPVAKYLHVMQGGLSSNLVCYVYNFFIMTSLGAYVQIWFSYFLLGLWSSWQNTLSDFGIIWLKFGYEFWLILFREYISPKLFAV